MCADLTGRLSATAGISPTARAYEKIDAADEESCRPDFALMIYPWCLLGTVGDCPGDNSNHTVNVPVSSANPPTFLTQTEDDSSAFVETSIFYYLQLKWTGAPPSELHAYPTGGHGYGRSKCTGLEVCEWPDRAATFLSTMFENQISER